MLKLVTQDYKIDSLQAIEQKICELKDAKRVIKSIESKVKALESEIKAYMGESDTLKGADGVVLATWKEQIVTRFDSYAFEKEHCELYEDYSVCSLQKRFLIK